MKPVTLLAQYLEERNQLLKTISELLERDPGVSAAWLFGSLGRGDEDALSDIDLWVIVDDDQIDNVVAQPRQYIYQVGSPVLFLEAKQNAPEGGAYLMVCYDAPIAPHIVDWYWQPQSLAFIPGQVRLLFNRAGLLQKDQPIHFPEREDSEPMVEPPIHFISYFWMMFMITAKHAFRSPWSEEMVFLPHLLQTMVKTRQFLGQDDILLSRDFPPQRSPGEKMRLLYQLADQMKKMMAILYDRGEEVPVLITTGAERYLKLIESALEDNEQEK